MQEYEFQINLPGIAGFDRKGEPIANAPTIEKFQAHSGAEARTIAAAKFKASGLGITASYNVSIA